MMLWLATIVQPELFSDIDIIEEIKYYYREFYEFELTDEQAQKCWTVGMKELETKQTYEQYWCQADKC